MRRIHPLMPSRHGIMVPVCSALVEGMCRSCAAACRRHGLQQPHRKTKPPQPTTRQTINEDFLVARAIFHDPAGEALYLHSHALSALPLAHKGAARTPLAGLFDLV